jgi:hypothetical protein
MRHTFVICLALLVGCSKQPTNENVAGVYRGTGTGFVETLTVKLADQPSFRHVFEMGGRTICDETGSVVLKGDKLQFPRFTKCVDDATGAALASTQTFVSYDVWFLGAPPFDMLKPSPEHEYFMRKIGGLTNDTSR